MTETALVGDLSEKSPARPGPTGPAAPACAAGGHRQGRVIPRVRPGGLHHRGDDPRQRWSDRPCEPQSGREASLSLEQRGLTLSEVTQLVSELETSTPSTGTTTFGLSGNVTIDLLGTYLRKHAVLQGSRADVRSGAFGRSPRECPSIRGGWRRRDHRPRPLRRFPPGVRGADRRTRADQLLAQADRYRSELAILLAEARRREGRVHRSACTDSLRPGVMQPDAVDRRRRRLQRGHRGGGGSVRERPPDLHGVDQRGALVRAHAHDVRSYQRFRAPFTPAFLDEFAGEVYYATRGFGAYFYKALVLDCDGTLWGGILGEDLAEGIKLGPFGYPGSMYWRMQHEFLALQRHGVLLCLCSKNDAADVDEVLASHPDMVLRDEHFVAKRVNWDDKVANLESLASDLEHRPRLDGLPRRFGLRVRGRAGPAADGEDAAGAHRPLRVPGPRRADLQTPLRDRRSKRRRRGQDRAVPVADARQR